MVPPTHQRTDMAGETAAVDNDEGDPAEVDGSPERGVLDAVSGGGGADDPVSVPLVHPATRTADPSTTSIRRVTRPPRPPECDIPRKSRTRPSIFKLFITRINPHQRSGYRRARPENAGRGHPNLVHRPSEITSTVSSTTLIAVCSSMA